MVGKASRGNPRAAKAMRPAFGGLRRHPAAGVVHGVFPRRERLMLQPFRAHLGGYLWFQLVPCLLERSAGLLEGFASAGALLRALVAAGVETAGPLPPHPTFGSVDLGDAPDANVSVKNVPSLVMVFAEEAAGQGHCGNRRYSEFGI